MKVLIKICRYFNSNVDDILDITHKEREGDNVGK